MPSRDRNGSFRTIVTKYFCSTIVQLYNCDSQLLADFNVLKVPGNLEMAFTLQSAFLGSRASLVSLLVQAVAATVIIRILLNVRQQILIFSNVCLLTELVQVFYNLFLHPLKDVPGPLIAKIFPYYMQLAVLKGIRCHVS